MAEVRECLIQNAVGMAMDREEAMRVLTLELEPFRQETYAQLVERVAADSIHIDRIGPAGVTYQIEITFLWEAEPGGNVLVVGSIDDGGWRAFVPFTQSFSKAAG